MTGECVPPATNPRSASDPRLEPGMMPCMMLDSVWCIPRSMPFMRAVVAAHDRASSSRRNELPHYAGAGPAQAQARPSDARHWRRLRHHPHRWGFAVLHMSPRAMTGLLPSWLHFWVVGLRRVSCIAGSAKSGCSSTRNTGPSCRFHRMFYRMLHRMCQSSVPCSISSQRSSYISASSVPRQPKPILTPISTPPPLSGGTVQWVQWLQEAW